MKQTDEGDYNMGTVRQMRSAWWCPVPHPPSVLENTVSDGTMSPWWESY